MSVLDTIREETERREALLAEIERERDQALELLRVHYEEQREAFGDHHASIEALEATGASLVALGIHPAYDDPEPAVLSRMPDYYDCFYNRIDRQAEQDAAREWEELSRTETRK